MKRSVLSLFLAGILCLLKLGLEVCLGISCEGSFGNDLKVDGLGCLNKLCSDSVRVYVGAVIDDTNLGSQLVFADVLCGLASLVRIGEAYLEYIVTHQDIR